MAENSYDPDDMVRCGAVMIAGPLKLASYRVRDPQTGVFSPLQFHMTFDNTVMAVMGEDAAKCFANFVSNTLANEAKATMSSAPLEEPAPAPAIPAIPVSG